jgi:hypothetical protein
MIELAEDNADAKLALQKELNAKVKAYEDQCRIIEAALTGFALEHNLDLSLGDYGSGRVLLLENDKWSGKRRGEWLYSSDSC